MEDVDDDDDDEETLQLKLAAIEARLKLKRLQQSRAKLNGEGSSAGIDLPPSRDGIERSPSRQNRFTGERKRKAADMVYHEDIQVPLSPSKKPPPANDSISPKRVVLGIDKGVRGSDVSLRRPRLGQSNSDMGVFARQTDWASQKKHPQTNSFSASTSASDKPPRPKSFSDRIREGRAVDKVRRQKAQNTQQNRSRSFNFDKKEVEGYQEAAAHAKPEAVNEPTPFKSGGNFSRADVMQSFHRPNSSSRRDAATPTFSRERRPSKLDSSFENEPPQETGTKAPDPTKFEAFSGLHLSNRILPHSFLTRTLDSKSPMRITDLLKTVKGPEFDLPETITDYVVFGIVASKSSPREHKDKKEDPDKKDRYDDGTNNSSKYMVITLTDLKWTIDLFLFSTAFPRYYKLSTGTLIAILNPSIMPPPRHKIDTNAFSLTLSSSEDTILEIGTAKDIGFCKAVRRDGQVCESWVDGRKTEYCDFHVDAQLRKTTAGRMEVNSGPGIRGRTSGFRPGTPRQKGQGFQSQGEGLRNNRNGAFDRTTGSTYFVAPAAPSAQPRNGDINNNFHARHRSAASLLDMEDPFISSDTLSRGGDTKAEKFRKRLADQERERNIARKLGEFKGVGAEYLRVHVDAGSSTPAAGDSHDSASKPNNQGNDPDEYQGLDNLSKKASNVKLGPMRKAIIQNKSQHQRGRSASPKKTRFITANGIKEAGRDSLVNATHATIDYDDDLDIV